MLWISYEETVPIVWRKGCKKGPSAFGIVGIHWTADAFACQRMLSFAFSVRV